MTGTPGFGSGQQRLERQGAGPGHIRLGPACGLWGELGGTPAGIMIH